MLSGDIQYIKCCKGKQLFSRTSLWWCLVQWRAVCAPSLLPTYFDSSMVLWSYVADCLLFSALCNLFRGGWLCTWGHCYPCSCSECPLLCWQQLPGGQTTGFNVNTAAPAVNCGTTGSPTLLGSFLILEKCFCYVLTLVLALSLLLSVFTNKADLWFHIRST